MQRVVASVHGIAKFGTVLKPHSVLDTRGMYLVINTGEVVLVVYSVGNRHGGRLQVLSFVVPTCAWNSQNPYDNYLLLVCKKKKKKLNNTPVH
jgi:hypothetical protein